jgi:phosphate transport system substrate-binding protein
VTGVAGTAGGLGYFGFSYFEQNQDKLNLVGVGEDAASCKKPDAASIQDGSYKPLSRPLFMYPSDKALQRPEVKAFMEFVVNNYADIAKASKIVPMTDAQAQESKTEVDKLAGAS